MIKYLVVDQSTGPLYYLYKRFKSRRSDPVPSGLYDHDALTISFQNLREYCDMSSTMNSVSVAQYLFIIDSYHGNVLLVGINYDKKSKSHDCIIEQLVK